MNVRVTLPLHLRRLAKVDGSEVTVEVQGDLTIRTVLDALESKYPTLKGTTRDHVTKQRRSLVRFFANGEDFSNEEIDTKLPDSVARGEKPFMVVGSIAGG